MAEEKEEDLDLDAKQPSGKKRWVIFALLGLLLVGASVGTTWLLLGGSGSEAESAEEQEADTPQLDAHYFPLEQLTVNFGQGGPVRFLQVDIQVMARDKQVFQTLENHMPVVRNDILLLLGSQKYEEISTREGKEALREEIHAAINRVLQSQADSPGIEAVYFTNFVMQ